MLPENGTGYGRALGPDKGSLDDSQAVIVAAFWAGHGSSPRHPGPSGSISSARSHVSPPAASVWPYAQVANGVLRGPCALRAVNAAACPAKAHTVVASVNE